MKPAKKRYYVAPFLLLAAIYLFVAAYNINSHIRNMEWTPFEEGYRVGEMYPELIEQDIADLRPQLVLTMILGTTTLLVGIILLIPEKKSKEKAGAIVSAFRLLRKTNGHGHEKFFQVKA